MSDMVRVRVLRAVPPNMPGDEASFDPERAARLIERGLAAPIVDAPPADTGKPEGEPAKGDEKPEPVRKSVDSPPADTAIRRGTVRK